MKHEKNILYWQIIKYHINISLGMYFVNVQVRESEIETTLLEMVEELPAEPLRPDTQARGKPHYPGLRSSRQERGSFLEGRRKSCQETGGRGGRWGGSESWWGTCTWERHALHTGNKIRNGLTEKLKSTHSDLGAENLTFIQNGTEGWRI